jgi:hypothetical protein
MADTKITALTALTAADPANDVIPIVDVSDTSMAASGTTKKISVNNILGASGTATLASATITGTLTIGGATSFPASVINTSGGNPVFTPTASTLFLYSGSAFLSIRNQGNTQEIFNLTPAGVYTFGDGAGGTRMTLNSTGLGIGAVPGAKLDVTSTNNAFNAIQARYNSSNPLIGFGIANSNGYAYLGFNTKSKTTSDTATYEITNTATQLRMDAGQFRFNIAASGTAGADITFTQAMTLDASGRLLVGSTSAFTDLTGSKEVKIGDGGMQTFSSAITAATATNIARSGFGALVHVAASNATGQYSAVVIFTSASATVVSVINGTGSTITFGVASGFLQITSSLALTNLVASGLRNN